MAGQGSMTGKVFGARYQINDRIGVGGMAEVYRAQDTVLGRNVAVKVMLPQYATDSDFTRRFRQEAAASANLQSPYIVNVYDWGQEDQTYYIVMEFVRGGDLKTAIQQRGAINQRKVAEIGSQVCQALSVAHKQDIIHRDIKPQNIMVQPDGNVKVMDFGIARAKNSVNNKTSSVLGTAHYISPEQAQGKELTPASDIYSLGVVLYEAVTGKLPFDGPDAVSVALMHVKDYPPEPHEINPDIDPALEDIIMTALEKDPADRFATANDMRLALNDYLAGRTNNDFTQAQTRVMGAAAADAEDPTKVMQNVDDEATNYGAHGREPDQNDSKKKSHRNLIIGIIIAVVDVCAIAAIAWAVTNANKEVETVNVPDVVGKTQTVATQEVERAGLVVKISVQNDNSVESGLVISQTPTGGEQVDKGSTVTLIISLGAETFELPSFVGLTVADAQVLADQYGLTLSLESTETSGDVDPNCIIRQSPEAGASAKAGDTVYYVLSTGAPNVDVPSVVGFDQESARTTLENAGLSVNIIGEYSDTVIAGNVIRQSIDAGTSVERGSSITLYVSSGSDPNKVTPSANEQEDQSGTTSGSEGTGGGADDPDAGSNSSSSGSDSSGSGSSGSAPSVEGLPQSSAVAELNRQGFDVNVVEGHSGTVDPGEVYRQTTDGNTVTIYVETGSGNEAD